MIKQFNKEVSLTSAVEYLKQFKTAVEPYNVISFKWDAFEDFVSSFEINIRKDAIEKIINE